MRKRRKLFKNAWQTLPSELLCSPPRHCFALHSAKPEATPKRAPKWARFARVLFLHFFSLTIPSSWIAMWTIAVSAAVLSWRIR